MCLVVMVEFCFDGEIDGFMDLYLFDNWGGEFELWNGIELLVVEDVDVLQGDEVCVCVLIYVFGVVLIVCYQFVQDWQGVFNVE